MLYFMMRRVDNLDGFTLNVLFLHYYYCFVSVVNVHTVVHTRKSIWEEFSIVLSSELFGLYLGHENWYFLGYPQNLLKLNEQSNMIQIYVRTFSYQACMHPLWLKWLMRAFLMKNIDVGPDPKGQIKSEWIYEIINFQKNDPKNLKDFCPKSFYST